MKVTLLPAELSSSSALRTSRGRCVVHAGDWKIGARLVCAHWSPCWTDPSCMSLSRFGVIQTKFGVVDTEPRSLESWVKGTMRAHRAAFPLMSVKLMKG